MSMGAVGTIVLAPACVVFRDGQDARHAGLVEAAERRRLWRPDQRVDTIIREAYRRLREQNDRTATRWACEQTGWPKYKINRRAAELGLAHVKEPVWAPAELVILQEHGYLGVDAIVRKLAAAGFHRTRTGVLLKRKRLQLTARHLGGYTGNALAQLFGVDNHKVYQWIECGLLPGARRETCRTERQGGDSYWIRREAVRAFLYDHPDEYDLAKVEKWWFLGLLTDGRISR
jgi:hypothetical protein